MPNPFDAENGVFLVLKNDQDQYSLWPAAIDVPAGWTVERDRDTREASLKYIDETWTDMRPRDLVEYENRNRS